jgi:protein-S-isoprenylcysteine O-methyltransferase
MNSAFQPGSRWLNEWGVETIMPLEPPVIIGPLWGAFEIGLSLARRSKSDAISKDRRSLGLIWLVALSGVGLGIAAVRLLPGWEPSFAKQLKVIGCGLFGLGLGLRIHSIICLGRFFTTNVSIASDHRLIDSGPYRFVRHPSYTGSLMAMFGCALTFANWAALLLIFLSFFAINLWRIRIEEEALEEALGEDYRRYKQRTKRLIPFIY